MIKLDTYNKRDGISQSKRLTAALAPGWLKIVREDPAFWLSYLRNLSSSVIFFDENNQKAGDWRCFFPASEKEIEDLIDKELHSSELAPHQSLLIAFLEMLQLVQKDMNGLVQKQLEYYYQKVLGIRPRAQEPDRAYVLFELARGAKAPQRIAAGTKLSGGKDGSGKELIYEVSRELIVNSTKVGSIKTVFVDGSDGRVYAAPIANSADGKGASLPKEAPFWNTFGESQSGKVPHERTMGNAEIGFAIASPILLLKEGIRSIMIDLTIKRYQLREANIQQINDETIKNKLASIRDVDFGDRLNLETRLKNLLTDTEFNNFSADILGEVYYPFRNENIAALDGALKLSLSSEEDWLPIESKIRIIESGSKLRIQIEANELNASFPAITAFPAGSKSAILSSRYPTLRIFLDHDAQKYPYLVLKGISIEKIKISVSADGVENLIMANDAGVINPGVPFFPFGPIPVSGAKFYIGSPEVFQKKLDKLTLNLSWADLPGHTKGFEGHYESEPDKGYNSDGANRADNEAFQAKLEFLSEGKWIPESGNSIKLFTYQNPSGTIPGKLVSRITRSSEAGEFDIYTPSFPKHFSDFQAYRLGLAAGFIRLELLPPDFGHALYSDLYTEAVVAFAKPNGTWTTPNKPYTPKLNHLSLAYEASLEIDSFNEAAPLQFFQIGPFGLRELTDLKTTTLLPDYKSRNLYLGLEDLASNQNLSLLIHQLEGSGDADYKPSDLELEWAYLSKDKWQSISKADILVDSTVSLNTTGILELRIGGDINKDNSWLPKEYFWLRASSAVQISGVNKSVDIYTQAAEARLASTKNAEDHFEQPLEKGSINKTVEKVAAIKSVNQPLASFGGRGKEKSVAFSQRISERLRHKKRASTTWDYERIVLNQFPGIFKVKCLKHVSPAGDHVPGAVTLLVIPDLKDHRVSNPFEPKVSVTDREQIKNNIGTFISPFTTLYVETPQFEPLKVQATVAFKSGFDGSYYAGQLNEAIKRFLSPWAFDEGDEIEFGGRIYLSKILAFIESLTYVDFVADLKVFHQNQGLGVGQMEIEDSFEVSWGEIGQPIGFVDPRPGIGGIGAMEIEDSFVVTADDFADLGIGYAEASQVRSILISAHDHSISVLQNRACSTSNLAEGVGAMYVEVNFIVA